MAIAFEDSKRALEQQLSTRLDIVHLILLGFLASLLIWAVSGDIDIYRTSVSGVIKTQSGTLELEPEVDGTIDAIYLSLGEQVKKGQLLLQLKDDKAKLQLTKLQNELNANRQQQRILSEQSLLTQQKYQLLSTSLKNEIGQTEAQLRQAQKVLQTQINIEQRMKKLAKTSAVAEMDLLKQNLEVVRAQSATEVYRITLDNKNRQLPANERERDLALSQINSQLTDLKDNAEQLQKAIEQAELELEKYRLYASKAGEVVQLKELVLGNKVSKGQRLATISDGSGWLLQTRFKAADAIGHIAKGQPARVQVDGFAWRQYGTLSATVSQVAKQGDAQHVTVLLNLDSPNDTNIPLTYGQPVTVEVKTESLAPLMLLLNAVDKKLAGKNAS